MKPYPSKKTRATIENARQTIHGGPIGGWSRQDAPTEIELEQMVAALTTDLREIVENQFPKTDNVEYAILKSHLLVEYVLTRFIECFSYHAAPNISRFSFSHKLDIAAMLGFGANCNRTIPSIEMLNKIRNQVAHRFEIDVQILDELYCWWAEHTDSVSELTDANRIEFLHWFCGFIAGSVSGQIYATTFMFRDDSTTSVAEPQKPTP